MKKISLFLLLTMLVSLRVCAYDYYKNNLYYNLYDIGDNDNNIAEVISCDKKVTGSVTIPAKLNINGKNYLVLSIEERAFQNCSGLTSVTIGNNVSIIGYMAFDGCSGLTSITIPNSVTSIEPGAFWNCSSLTSITIPYGVDSIAASAFRGCSSLKSITIPRSVKSIGVFAFSRCSGLTSVTIPYSVKLIGWNAFSDCSGLTSIEIPNSVTSIGDDAFSGCSGLTSVTIGNSVTSIGNYAFKRCSGLTSITIPNSVTSIGEGAFSGCSGLSSVHIIDLEAWCKISFGDKPWSYIHHLFMNGKEIKDLVIPNSVTSISDYAFYCCSGLTSVTIPNSVTSIGSYAFYDCRDLTSVTIPNSVTSIGAWAFGGCYGLTSITIPNSVTSIGYEAFAGCSGLTSITIPNSVTSIGYYAFASCSGLRSVTCETTSVPSTGNDVFYNVPLSSATLYVPFSALEAYRTTAPWSSFGTKKAISFKYGGIYYGFNKTTKQATVISGDEKYTGSVSIPETVTYDGVTYSVTSIGGSAFYGCSGLTSVTIPNSVTSIGEKAFYGCSGLTSVTIPNGVTSIENYAFQNCSGLTSVTIPDNVTSIGSSAFSGCSGLTSIIVGSGNTKYDSRGNCNAIIVTATKTLIAGCKNTVIPNSVTSIGEYAFYNCSGLTSVTIPNSVTSIGSSAFYGCSGLTSITIPNSVTSIADYAFYGCSSLTSVTCEATSVPSTGSNVFGVYLSSATLYVPSASVDEYKKTAPWSSFGTIKTFNLIDGIYYEFDKTTKRATVISGDEKYTGNVNIPETVTYNGETYSVTSIGADTFRGCSGLTSVTIPNSVLSIRAWAFQYCYGLTSVTCEATSVPSTGSNVFGSVYLSRATLYVPASALETYKKTEPWSSFGTIKVLEVSGSCGDNVYYTFNYPTGVLKITGTGSMNNYNPAPWYSYNYDIKSVEISDGVTSIGNWAFYNCSGLTSVTIPNSVTSIGRSAFDCCSGLTSVTIPNSVKSIGNDVFYNCSGLTSIDIPNSVTSIGGSAFNGCSGLTSITIPNSVTSIGAGAFENCSGLTSVTIPNSVTSIENWAFSGCSRLTSVTIPNSVKSIGNDVFYDCSGLINVYCHAKNVPSTGSYVFYNFPQSSATLFVPSASVDAYKKTAPWSGFGNIIALPEPLNYYDYGLTMKTLTDKAEWANIMKSAPNAVAVAEAELEEWAASQTNVIVKKNNSYYCPNFILTDLTEIAGSGYEKTGFYSPYDFTVKKGSYRRQAYAGYNTICVPFSFTASDLSGTAKTYAFEHYDDGEGKAIFKRVTGTIAAGTPCIVKESGNVVWNINLANKKISASSSSEDSHMRGTFVSTDVYQGKGYSPNSVNEFSPLSQYLHPFRACLILGSVSGARSIRLVLDDAVTDIDEVEVDSATLKNGKYLEKGKLVIYKSGRKYNANGSTIK